MDDLTGEFVAETRETLEHVSEVLIAWESEPHSTARLDEIFRFVHTVKGSCGFLGLPRIEKLAHAAETVLDTLRDGTRNGDAALVGAILAIIDRIAVLTDALESGDPAPEHPGDEDLIAALDADYYAHGAAPLPMPAKMARNVRIAVDLLDTMMTQVSDLVLVRNELARALHATAHDGVALAALENLSGRVGDLRDSIARARMQPIERLFAALPRLVRDTAAELGKSVRLVVEGSDVELDREMVEQLRDPLLHIVRNSIDHGIESPEQRIAAGKSAESVLKVIARQTGNQVAIEIVDDGRGIDIERLRSRAVAAGIVDAREAERLSNDTAAELIFSPGLSTAAAVTAISGRGVGMDVARSNIARIGGSISLDNRPGAGLSIDIRAPLTLSIVNVLTITAADMCFAIPRAVIEEVFAAATSAVRIEQLGAARVATIRDEKLSLVSLATSLGLPGNSEGYILIVQPAGGRRYALLADAIGDHEEVVVRPVAPALASSGLYAGQTLPHTGRPLLVLDTLGLARRARLNIDQIDAAAESAPKKAVATVSILVFTGLDGLRRGVRTHLVERIEDVAHDAIHQRGDDAFVTLDGSLYRAIVNGPLPSAGKVAMLRLSNGSDIIGYPICEVHDLVRIDERAIMQSKANSVALAAGAFVQLIDGDKGFAVPATAAVAVILGSDDPWAKTILEPLLHSAGYEVTFDVTRTDASLFLRLDPKADVAVANARVIDLHDGKAGERPGSIDRSDRAAITQALEQSKYPPKYRQEKFG